MYKERSRGFTLVELLVVTAIIGLLTALLFPVYARVRENGRRTTCASNEKQIGTACKLYAQDYDDRLPLALVDEINPSWPLTWDMQVQPYLKSGQVLMCPSDTLSKRIKVPNMGNQMFRTYSMPENAVGKHLAEVPSPTSSVLLLEAFSVEQPGTKWGWIIYATASKLGKATMEPVFPVIAENPQFWHNETGNYLFLDLHLKALKGPNPKFPGYKQDGEGIACAAPKTPFRSKLCNL